MDENQTQHNARWRSSQAWIAAALVAFCCIYVDGFVISSIRTSAKLFDGLGVQLPFPTLLLLATRPRYFALFFFGAAFVVVGKEFALTRLRDRWMTTAVVFAAILVAAGLVEFILQLPLLITVNKLVDAK
ncbi:MAG: hypothetical protein JSS69_05660 [Acidobacteria bacterium]|nr:hypothetical protein [Acidobacteriota bacterium]MBS1865387.1 hypothetical protein [Acidobacteriota bacterium]